MQNIDLFEKVITPQNGKSFKIAILRAGVSCNPEMINAINTMMDNAVSEYVGTKGHNTFVEEHRDTPNIRIVISDFNNIGFKPLEGETL